MQLITGGFVTAVSLMVISSTTKKSDKNNLTTRMNQPLMEDEEDNHERLESVENKINGETVDQEDMHSFPITSATIFFQLLLILAAVYYSMLLTNWGNPSIFDGGAIPLYSATDTSFWVKLSAQWLSTLIYLFSMFAPMLFPDREF